MYAQTIAGRLLWAFVLAVASGCAAKEKERITMLENANRNLTDRLNQTRGELERERAELNRRLQASMAEMSTMRQQMSERPTTEPVVEGWTPVPGGAMIAIEGQVLFAPGKVDLRNEGRSTLDAILSAVQGTYSGKDVLVFGHTDDQPIKKSGWKDNYELSAERALAVVRYLREHGVTASRLVACGCGEHRPRVPNSSNRNRSSNRRVEIYALDPQLNAGRPG